MGGRSTGWAPREEGMGEGGGLVSRTWKFPVLPASREVTPGRPESRGQEAIQPPAQPCAHPPPWRPLASMGQAGPHQVNGPRWGPDAGAANCPLKRCLLGTKLAPSAVLGARLGAGSWAIPRPGYHSLAPKGFVLIAPLTHALPPVHPVGPASGKPPRCWWGARTRPFPVSPARPRPIQHPSSGGNEATQPCST